MYGIWLVTVLNGQQRPIAVPAVLVLAGAATATAARAIATAAVRAIAVAASLAGHFYTCRTEC